MSENKEMMKNKREDKDTVVTAVSLIVIALQSLVIILGFIYRWDWLAYECAAMLIIPAAIVLVYGVKAIVHADQLMSQEMEEKASHDEN